MKDQRGTGDGAKAPSPKMRKKKRGFPVLPVFAALIVISGLCLVLYPSFSDWWNKRHNTKAIAGYEAAVEGLSEEEITAMFDAASAYNGHILDQGDRFHPDEETHAWYESCFDTDGSGMIGYIEIPSIKVTLPVYHGTSEGTLQVAAGHLEGTSLPVGRPGIHAAVSGHDGLPSARLFTDIVKLAEGDTFRVSVLGRDMWYRVYATETVLPDDMSGLRIEDDRDIVTLITCVPYGVNSHRLLVHGERMADVSETIEEEKGKGDAQDGP